MTEVLLTTHNLGYKVLDKTLFSNLNLTIQKGDRIALIGNNGTGKSTLLKLFAGMEEVKKGDIKRKANAFYLPQLDLSLLTSHQSILDFLLQYTDEWWEILSILEQVFQLIDINPEQELSTLSGGELMKLVLSIGLYHKPSILLLDEPTNHLDLHSLQTLIGFIHSFKGATVAASHDAYFIDQIATTIWELEAQSVHIYGGNFTSYQKQKEADREAKARRHESARKEVNKIKRSLSKEKERTEKEIQKAALRPASDRSDARIQAGYFKNKFMFAASQHSKRLYKQLNKNYQELDKHKKVLHKKAYVDLKNIEDTSSKKLIDLKHTNLDINKQKELLNDIEFSIQYGERVVITGRNGSGKSSFVKAFFPDSPYSFSGGKVYIAPDINIVYLSQKYELVNPDLSLIENIQTFNPKVTYEEARRLLGNFLFLTDDEVRRKAGTLSGGEAARLAFAMLTAAPIDLLILDEPTNNLDLETVNQIVDALQAFEGGLLVISHNVDFLNKIAVEKAYVVKENKLLPMISLPAEKDLFYQEIIEKS